MKLRKGDVRVQVLSGKERGKIGEISRALPKQNKVLIAGVNISKRHTRPVRATIQGGIIDKDMPLPASAVAILCPKDGPTRIRYQFDEAGEQVSRLCKVRGPAVSAHWAPERQTRLKTRYDGEDPPAAQKDQLGLSWPTSWKSHALTRLS